MLHEPWTDERVEMLRELWDRGLSASLIAAELGGATRNSVLGKVHRIGLPPRKPRKAPVRQPRARKPLPVTLTAALMGDPPRPAEPARRTYRVPPIGPADNGLRYHPRPIAETCPKQGRIGLLGLTDKTCKYPYGDPKGGMTYCGGRTAHGSPYCTAHHRLTHKPVEERDLREEKLARRVSRMAARRMYMAEAAE